MAKKQAKKAAPVKEETLDTLDEIEEVGTETKPKGQIKSRTTAKLPAGETRMAPNPASKKSVVF